MLESECNEVHDAKDRLDNIRRGVDYRRHHRAWTQTKAWRGLHANRDWVKLDL